MKSDENITPQQYGKCATIILTNMLKYHLTQPSLANACGLLGQPSDCDHSRWEPLADFLKYYGNPRTETFYLNYSDRGVSIGFSVLGYASCVIVDHASFMLPDQYVSGKEINSKQLPIIHWPSDRREDIDALLKSIDVIARDYKKESDWVRHIFLYAPDPLNIPDKFEIPCKAEVSLIEYHSPDIAAVYFRIQGQHEFYCDTWWTFVKPNGWEIDACRLDSQKDQTQKERRIYKIGGSEEVLEGGK